MEIPLTSDADLVSFERLPLHIPTEVCENVIDKLYSGYPIDALPNITTLHSCALVCRAWRVRSQRVLFYFVQLRDATAFRKFAATLDAGQHLRVYVHQLDLTAYDLRSTTNIFTLFPAVFAKKLPNLKLINIVHIPENSAAQYPRPPDPPKFKVLPYIPLHPRFPHFLSTFTSVSSLSLGWTIFRSFTEFARMLRGLPNLEDISCHGVRWLTPGGSHPDADFMRQPDWEAGRCTVPPFAPKLRVLRLADMAKYGLERLIWTRGPHLTQLYLTIPLLAFNSEEKDNDGALDLSSCTGLETLTLFLYSTFSVDKHAKLITEMLTSWKPQRSAPHLYLHPYHPPHMTRREYAGILRDFATIIEAWIQTAEPPSDTTEPQNHVTRRYRLCVGIFDWEAKREWWSNHLDSCFPTFVQRRQLDMEFITPLNKALEWATEG